MNTGMYTPHVCPTCLTFTEVPYPVPANSTVICRHGHTHPLTPPKPNQALCTQVVPDHVRHDSSRTEKGIAQTLNERGARYGVFAIHAQITQALKEVMRDTPNWDTLSTDKKEALEMLAHKIGRILNGDPEYKDSWVDIEGYVHLVSETLDG